MAGVIHRNKYPRCVLPCRRFLHHPLSHHDRGAGEGNEQRLGKTCKYLYLFDEPRTARITLEEQVNDDAPIVFSITSHNKLLVVDGNHYFTAKTHIRSNGSNAQPGLKVLARIVVSDKTLWQQVFKE